MEVLLAVSSTFNLIFLASKLFLSFTTMLCTPPSDCPEFLLSEGEGGTVSSFVSVTSSIDELSNGVRGRAGDSGGPIASEEGALQIIVGVCGCILSQGTSRDSVDDALTMGGGTVSKELSAGVDSKLMVSTGQGDSVESSGICWVGISMQGVSVTGSGIGLGITGGGFC